MRILIGNRNQEREIRIGSDKMGNGNEKVNEE